MPELLLSIAGLPPTALTGGGRWKQRSSKEATHLPFRAGYNWIRTASAGIRFAQKRFALAKHFSFSAYSAKLCLHMARLFGIIRIELPEGMTSRFFRAKTQTYERNDPK
jgi:flavodoxin